MEIKNKCLYPIIVPKVTGNLPLLRCGKCVGCLRQKSNELAVRAFREFIGGQDVAFLTFTYDDKSCPIFVQDMVVDTTTGEIINYSESIARDIGFFENAPYVLKINKKCKPVKRYSPLVIESPDDYAVKTIQIQYQTVYYEDVKLLFKRFRFRYPGALKKFICCQEYGSLGYRPHYHLLVYGLSKVQIQYLVDDWQGKYGRVDARFPDCKDAYQVEKISAYIAKYCNKGSYDCPFIKDRVCIKPKRASSIGFGKGCDFDKLVSYALASEITGIKSPFVDPLTLDKSQLRLLAERRKYMINGYSYPFPKYLLKLIFYEKIKVSTLDGVKYRYRASELQKAITSLVLADVVSDAEVKRNKIDRLYTNSGQINDYLKSLEDDRQMEKHATESAFIADLEFSSLY